MLLNQNILHSSPSPSPSPSPSSPSNPIPIPIPIPIPSNLSLSSNTSSSSSSSSPQSKLLPNQTPFKFPQFPHPPPPESPLSTSSVSSNSTFDSPSLSLSNPSPPLAGLQISHARYPPLSTLLPTAKHAASIRLISASDYAAIYDSYLQAAANVDEALVFPYLHCPDRPGTAQASYFSSWLTRRGLAPSPSLPAYRGLTVICADSAPIAPPDAPHQPPPCLHPHRRSLSLQSSLSDATSATSSSFLTALSPPSTSSPTTSAPDASEINPTFLLSSLPADQILQRDPVNASLQGRFLRKPLPSHSTVNLRLFGHQPAQYATISDIVVYSHHGGLSPHALHIAALCVDAQSDFKSNHLAALTYDYKVLVLVDRLDKFGHQPELQKLMIVPAAPTGLARDIDDEGDDKDPAGLLKRNQIDFFQRERLEMEHFTQASEIHHNVFLGNMADALRDEDQPSNSRKFTVYIEAHDQARFLDQSDLELEVTKLLSNRALAAHLEVPSITPCRFAGGQQPWLTVETLLRSLNVYCGWVTNIATKHGMKVLVHCHDGYTETSLFGLAYVMHALRIPLSQAYLHLQNTSNRSFFLYPSELTFLKQFERHVLYPSVVTTTSWLHHVCFDGHFPSRILPFLYLGNLSHASNPEMLVHLGVSAIVSMGESVTHLYSVHTASPAAQAIEILDIKSVADDGRDRIFDHFLPTLHFIEKHRRLGGKVLVHCRVGVSRSATIVIGYIMAHGSLDLASAYLIVRSRRLNILIQPNLVFMWALRRWESKLSLLKTSSELGIEIGNCRCGICGQGEPDGVVRRGASSTDNSVEGVDDPRFKAWTWSALALEISYLNQRYLC